MGYDPKTGGGPGPPTKSREWQKKQGLVVQGGKGAPSEDERAARVLQVCPQNCLIFRRPRNRGRRYGLSTSRWPATSRGRGRALAPRRRRWRRGSASGRAPASRARASAGTCGKMAFWRLRKEDDARRRTNQPKRASSRDIADAGSARVAGAQILAPRLDGLVDGEEHRGPEEEGRLAHRFGRVDRELVVRAVQPARYSSISVRTRNSPAFR